MLVRFAYLAVTHAFATYADTTASAASSPSHVEPRRLAGGLTGLDPTAGEVGDECRDGQLMRLGALVELVEVERERAGQVPGGPARP